MKLKQLFILLFILNTLALLLVAFIINKYQESTLQLEDAYNMQYKSLILADELRQSSDDLTRMARTYVITANPLFEEQYRRVLDIRNGEEPRPKRYNGIFWDFYTLEESTPLFDGKKIPLRILMKKANFPDEELNLLFTSQNESDGLTKLEDKAMNAIKGIFQDKSGNFTIYGEPDFKLARELMYSNEYHEAKIRIMQPLDDFFKAFEKRTKEKVIQSHEQVKEFEFYVNVVVVFSIIFIILSFFVILFRIVYSLESLRNIMLDLSKNDMSVELIDTKYDDEISDMMGSVKIFKKNTQNLISSETKLKEAINDARKANKAKSIFLARMSHELRTPLNAILGFASLVSKSPRITLQEKENLLIIKKSGKHLLNIINEILELSKIEAGKIQIINTSFDLHTLIKELETVFKFRCESKDLDFYIDINSSLPKFIKADEQRLRQILMNLLSNALKFTKTGSIKLYAYEEMNKLFFEVKDTGIGIEDKDIKRLFKPFEQIVTDNYNKNGTGLGLSITKELISLMGGDIYVKSKKSVGSEFFFSVNYELISEIELELKNRIDNIIGVKHQDNKTILVVDDIEENRQLVVQILNSNGFNTLEAKNGIEAIEIYEVNKIDLIFMDILMDKLGGIETTHILRNKFKDISLPIVILSANVFDEDKQKAKDSGATEFLSKPISEKKILLTLEKYLNIELLVESNIKVLDINIEDEFKKLDIEFIEKLNELSKRIETKSLKDLLKKEDVSRELNTYILKRISEFDYMSINKQCEKVLKTNCI